MNEIKVFKMYRNLSVEVIACRGYGWMVTFRVEMVEIAVKGYQCSGGATSCIAQGALKHGLCGTFGIIRKKGVTAMVSVLMVLSISGEEASVGGRAMLEEVPGKRIVEIGGGGIMEVRVVMGNPASGLGSVAIDESSRKGVLNMGSDIMSDTTVVMCEVILEGEERRERNIGGTGVKGHGEGGVSGVGRLSAEFVCKGISKGIGMSKGIVRERMRYLPFKIATWSKLMRRDKEEGMVMCFEKGYA
jgi:hypothetical protein